MAWLASIGYVDSAGLLAPGDCHLPRPIPCNRWVVERYRVSELVVFVLAGSVDIYNIVARFEPVDPVDPPVIGVGSVRPFPTRCRLAVLIPHADGSDSGLYIWLPCTARHPSGDNPALCHL